MKELYSKADERYLVCDKDTFNTEFIHAKHVNLCLRMDGGLLEAAGYQVFVRVVDGVKVVLANEQYHDKIVALLEADGFHVTT